MSLDEPTTKGFVPENKRKSASNLSVVKYAGYYVFGGLSDSGPTNRLTVIDSIFDGFRFIEPVTKGKPPTPRYLHSTHYLSSKKILVVVGGKVTAADSLDRELDIFCLELVDMTWMTVEARKSSIPTMCGHAGTNDEDRIYLFGGVDCLNYRDSGLLILEVKDKSSVTDMNSNTRKEIQSTVTKDTLSDLIR